MTIMEEVVGHIIAWNSDSCVAYEEEVSEDEPVPKSPFLSSKNICTLMDWVTDDQPVAQGRWLSRDPQAMVNGIPIGPNAVKVYVDLVLSPHAFSWRPTLEMTKMEQSLNYFIAWLANRVEIETHTESSSRKSPPKSKSIDPSPSLEKSTETLKTTSQIGNPQTSQPTPKALAKKTRESPQSPVRKSLII